MKSPSTKLDQVRALREARSSRHHGPGPMEGLREVTLPAPTPEASLAGKRKSREPGKAGVVDSNSTRSTKRGRPLTRDAHLSARKTQPWKAAGMSRATWYARRKAKP